MSARTEINLMIESIKHLLPNEDMKMIESAALKIGKYKICSKCNGTGKIAYSSRFGHLCLKCHGSGFISSNLEITEIENTILANPEYFKKVFNKHKEQRENVAKAKEGRRLKKEEQRRNEVKDKQNETLNSLSEENRKTFEEIIALGETNYPNSFISDVLSKFKLYGSLSSKQVLAVIDSYKKHLLKKDMPQYNQNEMIDVEVKVLKIEKVDVQGFAGTLVEVNKVSLMSEDSMIFIVKTNRAKLIDTFTFALENGKTMNVVGRIKWVAPSKSPIILHPTGLSIYE